MRNIVDTPGFGDSEDENTLSQKIPQMITFVMTCEWDYIVENTSGKYRYLLKQGQNQGEGFFVDRISSFVKF